MSQSPGPQLLDDRAEAVLERLHHDAKGDVWRVAKVAPTFLFRRFVLRQPVFKAATPELLRNVYIPIDRDQGALLYLTARALNARTIVEFGTSFGISTIYLAAAVRDNGGGMVIGTELEPTKHAQALANIDEAGLSKFVEVRVGDALQTLKTLPSRAELVLLDGWKDIYLPIIKLLTPQLAKGAVVFADNIYTFKKDLRPYVEFMQNSANGFVSTTLSISDGFEYSVYAGTEGARP